MRFTGLQSWYSRDARAGDGYISLLYVGVHCGARVRADEGQTVDVALTTTAVFSADSAEGAEVVIMEGARCG